MPIKNYILSTCLFLLIVFAKANAEPPFGQTIQINTYLHSFVGRPAWTLIIRDIDNGQNIPYLFDFTRGNDFWLALTYGRNYVITASILNFSPYRRYPYRSRRTHNFCHLESHGRIVRGESLHIIITGDLSPNTDTYSCQIMRYRDNPFVILNTD